MAKEFSLEIRSPASEVLKTRSSSVVLTGYDGEVGILPGHGDFIGLIGAGTLKTISDGHEKWFFVDGGIYQFSADHLLVLANHIEDPEEISSEEIKQRIAEFEALFADHSRFEPENYSAQLDEYHKDIARLAVAAHGESGGK